MKIQLIILLLLFSTLKSQIVLKISNDTIRSYVYTAGDEFNALSLNEKLWKNGLGNRRVIMSQDLAFSPKNVKIEQGLACFRASKEDSNYVLSGWEVDSSYLKKNKIQMPENKFMTKYSAGCIVSKTKFHYGLYELRFKVEEGQGIWPAFWFYGGNKNEEIDAFELKCEKNNQIHVDTHCPYGCDNGYKNNLGINTNWGGWIPITNYLHNGFNILLFEWKANELIWYINGYPLAYFKGSFANPMSLFLNTSVAKDGGAFKPGPNEKTSWPNTYYVDYLRIWQAVDASADLILKPNAELGFSNKFISDYSVVTKRKRGYMYRKKELNKEEGVISLMLSPQGKLTLTVLGKIQETITGITVKGINTNCSLSEFKQEIQTDINLLDKELELEIVTKYKTYKKKLILKE